MFDIKDLIRLIKVFEESSGVGELKIKYKEFELSLRKRGEGQQNLVVPPVAQVPSPPVPVPPVAPPTSVEQPVSEQKETKEKETEEKQEKPLYELRSPMVGTFYRRPDPDSPPYVEIGDKVKKGDVVCIIEAMKLFNEIKSDVNGTIKDILVEDKDSVEYNQVLFLIELDE